MGALLRMACPAALLQLHEFDQATWELSSFSSILGDSIVIIEGLQGNQG